MLDEQAQKDYVSPMNFANEYARLGDKQKALECLKKAAEEKSPRLIRLKVEPRWDEYRSEPKFLEIVQKMNF